MPNYNDNLGKTLIKSSVVMMGHFMSALLITMLATTSPVIADTDFGYVGFHGSNQFNYPIDFALALSTSDIGLRADDKHYPVYFFQLHTTDGE